MSAGKNEANVRRQVGAVVAALDLAETLLLGHGEMFESVRKEIRRTRVGLRSHLVLAPRHSRGPRRRRQLRRQAPSIPRVSIPCPGRTRGEACLHLDASIQGLATKQTSATASKLLRARVQ